MHYLAPLNLLIPGLLMKLIFVISHLLMRCVSGDKITRCFFNGTVVERDAATVLSD